MNDPFGTSNRRRLRLRSGKERVVANRHPWIFAGAIAKESGPEDAAIADLVDESGAVIASGFYSPHSQIRMRALTFGQPLTEAALRDRIRASVARRTMLDGTTNAARVVNAEGDELSGLIVDRYNDVLVVEISNAGVDQLRPLLVDALRDAAPTRGIFFKNDLSVRGLERISQESEWVGEGEPATEIVENGLRFAVDLEHGQKSGAFLDQRENRELVRSVAGGRSVLNLFAYTGGFSVYALAGGATSAVSVDVAKPALATIRTPSCSTTSTHSLTLHW